VLIVYLHIIWQHNRLLNLKIEINHFWSEECVYLPVFNTSMKLNADYKTLHKLWYKMKSTMKHEEWRKFIRTLVLHKMTWCALKCCIIFYVSVCHTKKKKAQTHLGEVKRKCNKYMFVWFWLEFLPEKWDMEALNIFLQGLYATDYIIMYIRNCLQYGVNIFYLVWHGVT
jgi:hypothetical protein